MARVKVTRFQVKREELIIRGKIYGEAEGSKPCVILCHGFMMNHFMCKTYAIELAEMGYISVVFDFTGGGPVCLSDGKTEDMTLYTEEEDLLAVYEYVISLPYVDKDNISLLGCSQGGLVAMMAASKLKEKVNKLILLYPGMSIPDHVREGGILQFTWDKDNVSDVISDGVIKIGRGYVESAIDMDPYEVIRGYGGKVLCIHGTKDNVVPISYSRRLKEVYNDFTMHEIDGAGHIFEGEYDIEARMIINRFMEN